MTKKRELTQEEKEANERELQILANRINATHREMHERNTKCPNKGARERVEELEAENKLLKERIELLTNPS